MNSIKFTKTGIKQFFEQNIILNNPGMEENLENTTCIASVAFKIQIQQIENILNDILSDLLKKDRWVINEFLFLLIGFLIIKEIYGHRLNSVLLTKTRLTYPTNINRTHFNKIKKEILLNWDLALEELTKRLGNKIHEPNLPIDWLEASETINTDKIKKQIRCNHWKLDETMGEKGKPVGRKLQVKELAKRLGIIEDDAIEECLKNPYIGVYIKDGIKKSTIQPILSAPRRADIEQTFINEKVNIFYDYQYKGYIRLLSGNPERDHQFEMLGGKIFSKGLLKELHSSGSITLKCGDHLPLEQPLYDRIMGISKTLIATKDMEITIDDLFFMEDEVDKFCEMTEKKFHANQLRDPTKNIENELWKHIQHGEILKQIMLDIYINLDDLITQPLSIFDEKLKQLSPTDGATYALSENYALRKELWKAKADESHEFSPVIKAYQAERKDQAVAFLFEILASYLGKKSDNPITTISFLLVELPLVRIMTELAEKLTMSENDTLLEKLPMEVKVWGAMRSHDKNPEILESALKNTKELPAAQESIAKAMQSIQLAKYDNLSNYDIRTVQWAAMKLQKQHIESSLKPAASIDLEMQAEPTSEQNPHELVSIIVNICEQDSFVLNGNRGEPRLLWNHLKDNHAGKTNGLIIKVTPWDGSNNGKITYFSEKEDESIERSQQLFRNNFATIKKLLKSKRQ